VWRYEAVRVPGRLLYQQDAMSVAENICAVVAGIFIGWLIARGLTR
jgi:F0F1-type ATP synthase assembly protein I